MQRGLQAATNMHLMLGGLAAGAALMVKAGSRLRAPLALLAGTELLQGVGGRDTSPGLSATPGEQAAEAPERVHSKRIAGIQMRWEEHGDRHSGIPVVLVHGLPTSPRVWRYLIPYLTADNRSCLAWEQVGFGGSLAEGLGRDLSIGRQAGGIPACLVTGPGNKAGPVRRPRLRRRCSPALAGIASRIVSGSGPHRLRGL